MGDIKHSRMTANPYRDPGELEVADFYSFDGVQEQLVEAFILWRRSPGGGTWPFAKDAPWHLMERRTSAGDYDARGGDIDAEVAPPPLPLTMEEVDQRDRVTAWIEIVPKDADRRLVCLAIRALASGHRAVPWKALLAPMGVRFGVDGLRKRYSRAITAICHALNARTC